MHCLLETYENHGEKERYISKKVVDQLLMKLYVQEVNPFLLIILIRPEGG
jgi:hypothetical protein